VLAYPFLMVRHAGDAEGLFRSRLAAWGRVRRHIEGHGQDRPAEATAPGSGRDHCGGSWWMVRVALGDPARKIIGRAVRALCARDCRVTWCVHYDMDRARPPTLRRFLKRVRRVTLSL
jgi:hypothetical protein